MLITLGIKNLDINVQVIPTKNTIAAAYGWRTLFNIVESSIFINDRFLSINNYTVEETKFVLAHECIHIHKSDLFIRELSVGFQQTIDKNFPTWSPYLEMIRNLSILVSPYRLPIIEGIIREQEITADKLATEITGNLKATISCLRKLCNQDLNKPSHIWEFQHEPWPIMTMGERIEELIRHFPP